MQATLTLKIVNKETMNVLNRTLKNGDNYYERVCIKLGLFIKASLLSNAYALATLYSLHDEIFNLSAYFDDEVDKFEGLIEKKQSPHLKRVNFIANFEKDIPCSNALTSSLAEMLENFDRLMSTLKLLHLGGLMESRAAFYALKQQYQKNLNALFSKIIQAPSANSHEASLQDVINEPERFSETINYHDLKSALKTPYAPGLSPQILHQLQFKLNKLSKNTEEALTEHTREASS